VEKKTKEKLYNDLNYILSLMEDNEMREAKRELNKLIQKIFYDQVMEQY
jgi:hypothetical protein